MENKIEKKTTEPEQLLVLSNRKNLSVSGTTKVISLKPDLIQLSTVLGELLVLGENLELIKLDNSSTRSEIHGNITAIKYAETKPKHSLLGKIFKWYFQLKIN